MIREIEKLFAISTHMVYSLFAVGISFILLVARQGVAESAGFVLMAVSCAFLIASVVMLYKDATSRAGDKSFTLGHALATITLLHSLLGIGYFAHIAYVNKTWKPVVGFVVACIVSFAVAFCVALLMGL